MRDLLSNKVRTALVILSISVGVFAIGLIAGTNVLLSRELTQSYLSINPAHAVLNTAAFDDELVYIVRRLPGVKEAEGRRAVSLRVQVAEGVWRSITLFVISDFGDIRIDKILPQSGKWGPSFKEILVERASVGYLNADVGDILVVETPEGRVRELRVVGTAHDINQFPTPLAGRAYGYITFDTLEWLGWERSFNELHIVVDEPPEGLGEFEYIRSVAQEVGRKVERSGRRVNGTWIPTPGEHPADEIVEPMLLILGVLGLLSLIMSGFLTVNTMTAILTQHTKQIGVMKAIGARRTHLMAMYLSSVLLLSLAALAVGIPAATIGARAFTAFLANLINFDIVNYQVGRDVMLLQIGVGLIVPLAAAFYPVWRGTRLTVREAISGVSGFSHAGGGIFDRLIERFGRLSRPLLLSLRNTFRRKGRLVMTLATLTLGGAIFIAVMSVHQSLLLTLDDALMYWNYDIGLGFSRAHRVETIEREALRVPGIARAESWGAISTRVKRADGTESDYFQMIAPPAGSTMMIPIMDKGRWLIPEDENAVVITTDVIREEPDLKVGDEITLEIDGRDSNWRIVGIARGSLSGPILYANYDYYAQVVRSVGRASNVRVHTESRDPAELNRLARELKEHFESVGMQVRWSETSTQIKERIVFQFNILVAFLLVMATLLAVVGALGLTGTMSINVLERIREIGVMRAIGATHRSIVQLVIVEGAIISVISWIIGSLLAVPLSKLMCNIVGGAFLQSPLSFSFSMIGLLLWLGIVVVLAAAASLLPAWNAARLTVRDVLAYE